jgi:hypothetical protein
MAAPSRFRYLGMGKTAPTRLAAARRLINSDSSMADSTSSRPPAIHPAHSFGRLTLWVVLALMLGAAVFAAWSAIANWSSIRV